MDPRLSDAVRTGTLLVAMTRRTAVLQCVSWTAALTLVAALLALVDYRASDPDSALHAAIVAQSYQRPIAEWIAPSWGGQWGRVDLYREHPAGLFLLPSLLARIGYAPSQAAYLVNAVFQMLTVLVGWRLAARLLPAGEARAVSWLLLFLPIAFTYRVRANHEQAVLLLALLALYATERARSRAAWSALTALAVSLTFFVKGVFALPLAAGCATWLALRPAPDGHRLRAWLGIAGALAAGVLAALAYEGAYRAVSGETFLGYYLPQQLGLAAAPRGSVFTQKLENLGWYTGRLLWFAFPWTLVLLGALANVARTRTRSRPWTPAPDVGTLLLPTLGVGLLWPLVFSLSDRRADRYIFPAYVLVGAAGAIVALRRYPAVQRMVARVERAFPYEQAAIWLALTLLALASALAGMPRVKL